MQGEAAGELHALCHCGLDEVELDGWNARNRERRRVGLRRI